MKRVRDPRNAFQRRAIQQRLQDKAGRPDFEIVRIKREIRVPNNDVETAEAIIVGMGFIPRIYNRTALHCVNALQFRKKVRSLRDLEAMLHELVFFLPAVFARAAINLTRYEEGNDRLAKDIPRKRPWHEVILMAAIAMPAKISVVLVEQNGIVRALLG